MVQEGKLDLALVNMHFYEIDKLNSFTVMNDKIVFCVSKSHPLAKCHEVTIEMIKNEPLISIILTPYRMKHLIPHLSGLE